MLILLDLALIGVPILALVSAIFGPKVSKFSAEGRALALFFAEPAPFDHSTRFRFGVDGVMAA